MLVCPQCQEIDDGDDARFCRACGSALHALLGAETRRLVTIVRCDVIGSTGLGELLDPEILRRVMGRYYEAARQVLRGHGGTVQKYIGDAVMAVFGIPTLHEDDALRAVRAAADLRVALRRLDQELSKRWGVRLPVRIGVQTGEVVAGDRALGDALVVGDAVNVAARLEQAAGHGEILIGEETWRLVPDAVEVEEIEPLTVRNRAQPVRAFRLLRVEPGAPGRQQRSESPMLGRDQELELLKWAFERACSERTCHLVTVLGMPGIGKSRLVSEFVSTIGQRARVLRGHCLPYGDGITFWPMVEVVRQAAGIAGTDTPALARMRLAKLTAGEERGNRIVDSVAQVLGLGEESDSGVPTDAFWALRALLELLARRQPLVVVIDDLHWAAPTLLDLVEYIADWAREVPILLLCMARPELREHRPQWAGGALNATSLLLTPLLRLEAQQVAAHLLGAGAGGTDGADGGELQRVSAQIAEMAEGNPLFIELFVSQLTEEGTLTPGSKGQHSPAGGGLTAAGQVTTGPADGHGGTGGRTGLGTAAAGGLPVPSTIQMLLAARLEQLGPAERAAIERAAIVGKQFHLRDIVALSDHEMQGKVRASLAALSHAELIGPDPTALFTLVQDDEAYRFRHLLMRDAAYQAMPKETRAELHERYATWLEKAAGEQTAQFDELIGYHFEQAYRLRIELGYRDERSAGLAARASERLAAAGHRALNRGDSPATVALLTRALALQPPAEPATAPPEGTSPLITPPAAAPLPAAPSPAIAPLPTAPPPTAPPPPPPAPLPPAPPGIEPPVTPPPAVSPPAVAATTATTDGAATRDTATKDTTTKDTTTKDTTTKDTATKGGEPARDPAKAEAAAGSAAAATAGAPRLRAGRIGPLLDLAEALYDVGELRRSVELYEEATRLARAAQAQEPDGRGIVLALDATFGLLETLRGYDLDALLREAPAAIERAFELFEGTGDRRRLSRSWRLRAILHLVKGECTAALPAIDRAVELARDAGDTRLEARNRRDGCVIRHRGPTPGHEVVEYTTQSLAWAREQGMRTLEAIALSMLARHAALAGDHAAARDRLAEADRIMRRIGARVVRAANAVTVYFVESRAGQPAAAERALRAAREELTAMRARAHLAPVCELLARTLLEQGRVDEAAEELVTCERVTATGDVAAQSLLWGLRARVLAATGDLEGAKAAAERGLATVGDREIPIVRAAVLLDAAEVYRRAGAAEDANRAASEAMSWYERKGMVPPVAGQPVELR